MTHLAGQPVGRPAANATQAQNNVLEILLHKLVIVKHTVKLVR
jgi:hypothetical protein